MRKIILMDNELLKYQVIHALRTGKRTDKHKAAQELALSVRQVNRLILIDKQLGKAGFVHGNRGRRPKTAYPLELQLDVIKTYKEEFVFEKHAFNLTHFTECYNQSHGTQLSTHTVWNWAYKHDVLSPKARRQTKKNKAKEIKNRGLKIPEAFEQRFQEAHPTRSRHKNFGEQIQMDASEFDWAGTGEIWHLHLAVDDCTSMIVGAYFDTQETLAGYYQVFKQILEQYGIPASFFTDNRTVFAYDSKKMTGDKDTMTQYAYACKQLGVALLTSSVSQAKGRIERANQSFQDRLTSELQRAKIKSREEANHFLKTFVESYNDRFALNPENFPTVFDKDITPERINLTLAVIDERVVDKGNALHFQNKCYQTLDKHNQPVLIYPKTKVLIIKTLDGELFCSNDKKVFQLKEIAEHQAISKEFDCPEKSVKKERRKYIPPLSHPWKRQSYLLFQEKQKRKQNRIKEKPFSVQC